MWWLKHTECRAKLAPHIGNKVLHRFWYPFYDFGTCLLKVVELNLYRDGDLTPYNQKLEDCHLRQCWQDVLKRSNHETRCQQVDAFNRCLSYRLSRCYTFFLLSCQTNSNIYTHDYLKVNKLMRLTGISKNRLSRCTYTLFILSCQTTSNIYSHDYLLLFNVSTTKRLLFDSRLLLHHFIYFFLFSHLFHEK